MRSPRTVLSAAVGIFLVLVSGSCQEVTRSSCWSGEVCTAEVGAVRVTPVVASFEVGTRLSVEATPLDGIGAPLADRTITWTSSNPAVALVAASGPLTAEVLGIAVGNASITATSESKASSLGVLITPVPAGMGPVASVTIDPPVPSVEAEQTVQLVAQPKDASGNVLSGRAVAWSSANPSIATVSTSGLVTGVSPGDAGITAAIDGKHGTANVSVMRPPVAAVDITPPTAGVLVGQTVQLTAMPKRANGNTLSGRVVTWASSNTSVATVSSTGLVSGMAAGTVTITATSEGKSGTASVTATLPPPASVTTVEVSPSTVGVVAGQTVQLTATPKDANGNPLTGRTVTWSSSNSAIATVSWTGAVNGVGAGTVTITATSEGKSGAATTTVTLPPVAIVDITPPTAGVVVGQTVQLTAIPKAATGVPLSGRVVTWASSNTSVASVSSTGLVSGIAAGTVTITATSEGKSGTASVTATLPPPASVATVEVSPSTVGVVAGQTVQLTATPKDASGNPLTGRTVTWSSSNSAIATVSWTGVVSGVSAGTLTITASSEGKSGAAVVTVTLPPVATVDITPPTAGVLVGQTVQLTAIPKDAAGVPLSGRGVTWASSNTAVATVSSTGLVSGIAAGTVTITATSEGKSGTATVTATLPPPAPVATVEVSPSTIAVVAGQTAQLTATPKDASGNALTGRTVTWSSSNTAIATVSWTGVVSGVGAGTATITATSEGKSGAATATVTLPPVATVDITPATAGVVVGQTVQLTATPKSATGSPLTGRTVTWASSNTAIATVSSTGLVSGVSAGQVTITATSEGKSGTATITATLPVPVSVAAVSVTPGSATVVAGEKVQLTATPRDQNGNPLTGRTVTWASSNTALATVSSTGLVTAVETGVVTITATSEGVSGAATITVAVPPVAIVSVTPSTGSVVVGQTLQLVATPKDVNGVPLTGRAVTWSSSNAGVANVSESGLVTGLAAGSVTITARSDGVQGTAAISVSLAASSPGAVTDLVVAATTNNSVTLSFTEVNNGAGAPASYDARYALSPLSWGSASSVTQGTCATPLAGTAIGTKRTCTVLGLTTATNYQFQLVAFRGTLNVNAVFGALSNVASGTTSASTAPVASVSVNPASLSLGVGTTQQVIAVLKDASGITLTGRTVSWSSSNTAIASVSATGVVTGVGAGTATITATSEGQSGTASVTVSASPPPGSWANEPSGFTTLTDYSGNVVPPPGWTTYDDPNGGTNQIRVVSDATAPRSPSSVYEHLYPAGFGSGAGGGVSQYRMSRNEIFIGAYFKYSDPWTQAGAGMTKLFYVFQHNGGDRQASYIVMNGSGAPYNLQWLNEPEASWWKPNVASSPIYPGRWYRLEVYMKKASATGASDGILRWWVDGVLQGNHTNARLRGQLFSEFHLNPVFGGGSGTTKPRDEYIRFDHIYISGR